MTSRTPILNHLAAAVREHRQRIGAGNVPSGLIALEAELWVALSGTPCPPADVAENLVHADRVLVTTDEAARMLALSPRTVRGLRASGRLPAVVIGEAVRFRVSDVTAFADDAKEA